MSAGDQETATSTVTSFDVVLTAELARIAAIRANKAARSGTAPADGPPAGLALSGGGIRSAAFGLGVLQALANAGILQRLDYLSTVSGGGYIGSALTWFLSDAWRDPAGRRFGTGPDDHPLGRIGAGAKTSNENDRIDHIRGFGNYLRPTSELWTGSAAAVVLRSMVIVVLLWFFPLTLLLLAADGVIRLVAWVLGSSYDYGPLDEALVWLWLPAALSLLLGLLGVRWLPPRLAGPFADAPRSALEYRARLATQNALGKWVAISAGLAVLAILPWLRHELGLINLTGVLTSITLAGVISTVSSVSGLIAGQPILKEMALRVGAVLLALGLLLIAATLPEGLAVWLQAHHAMPLGTARLWAALLMAAAAAVGVLAACRTLLNQLGLHRFYRDRLMETFLADPRPKAADAADPGLGSWRPAVKADSASLASMCDAASLGPYHLIGTNVILIGSEDSVVRNRGGESFALSPLFSGCDRTGWRPTDKLFTSRPLQLSTAMAVSGAALSPNTGAAGAGLTRGAAVSRLMMLFNLRLAYWVPNPSQDSRPNRWFLALLTVIDRAFGDKRPGNDRPRFAYPGLAALLGITHTERSGYLELSDGGHFENLGVYELVRRRMPLILVADGGMDPDFAFADLANAIERVRVDFGVVIEFDHGWFGLDGLQPDPLRQACFGSVETRVAERGWALARIRYQAAPKAAASTVPTSSAPPPVDTRPIPDGLLVYLKPALRAGLPAELLAYRAANPAFPHETTADQFFDEAQFEAYRELGYHTARELIDAQRGGGIMPSDQAPGAVTRLSSLMRA